MTYKASVLKILILFISLSITACGGDSGATPEASAVEQKGQFIDSPVSGMSYIASPSGRTGTTDASGTYSYEAGDTIEFFIGSISIGSAPAAPIMTPISIVTSIIGGTVDETNTFVLNIARFLQSIDEDGDLSNGIQIPVAIVSAAMGKTLDFTSSVFDADATTVLADLASSAGITAITGALASPGSALGHFSDSILVCKFNGSYSGTFSQTSPDTSDNGIWSLSVSSTGVLTGSGGSSVVLAETFDMTGTVTPNGTTEVTAGTTTTGATFIGSIDSDGNITGTWLNSFEETSGTFAGSRLGSASSCLSSSPGTGGGNTGVGSSLGSFAVEGDDVSDGSVASEFTPLWEAAVTLSPSTSTHVTWTDLDTSAPITIGSLSHQLELQFDSTTGDISFLTFRATHLAERSLFYFLDCSSGSCAGKGVTVNPSTKEVMFSGAQLSVSGIFGNANTATAPITLNGTIIYDAGSP